MKEDRRRRVAILGGGQAALTAALQITDPRNPEAARTEVTIYQLGWRLGGKGATGRPPGVPRILEHGLHNWFGFYDNSFRQARDVYRELDRPKGAPLRTFEEAFEPADEAVFVEWIEGAPRLWKIENVTNDAQPGVGGIWLEPLQYVAMAIEAIERAIVRSPLAALGHEDDHRLARAHALLRASVHGHAIEEASAQAAHELLRAAAAVARAAADGAVHPLAAHFERVARELERELPHEARGPGWIAALEDAALRAVCWLLWLFMEVLWRAAHDRMASDEERRLWIQANLAYACITGAVRDGVVAHGFDVVNDRDLRAWLAEHAFEDGGVMLRSPAVEAVYSGSFAFPHGDTRGDRDHPTAENMEAGTALRGIVRSLFTYKGAFAYRFAAGTADTCYAPSYEVLRARGVEVRFFSRVQRLELGEGGVERIHVGEQAQIAGGGSYEPLVDVEGLPCWPLEPRWEQLADGDWLREHAADLEWPSEEVRARERPFTLERGRDFDAVVLGIPIAALPEICGELIAAFPQWATAIEKVATVRTQALQIWLAKTPAQLGFPVEGRPITGWRYDELSPLNVWGDFSELLAMEHWPVAGGPVSLGYLCSTMPDDDGVPIADQVEADARARENAIELLRSGLPVVMPGLLDEAGEVRWEVLVDPRDPPATGPARLDAQWIRGNCAPAERYVLSLVGSSRHRLPVHAPAGPPNLYLAGDWTQCTINAGCMEAATISGMLCSNALCGHPPRDAIIGVDF